MKKLLKKTAVDLMRRAAVLERHDQVQPNVISIQLDGNELARVILCQEH